MDFRYFIYESSIRYAILAASFIYIRKLLHYMYSQSTRDYGQSAQARLIEVEAITYGSQAIIFYIYICIIKYGWRMKCKVMFDTLIFLHHNSARCIYSERVKYSF